MMSAMALPVSLPPYQAWTRPLTVGSQGMETGVPDCIITTVGRVGRADGCDEGIYGP